MALLSAAVFIAASPTAFAKSTLVELDERVEKLERVIEARSRAQVNLAQQIDSLQEEISDLRGVTEEHSYKLSQILQRQRDLYQEMDSRLSAVIEKTKEISQSGHSPLVPTTATSNDVQLTDNLNENEAYDRAVNMVLKDKLYDKAIPEFQSFIKTFPSSIYLPNAHYWLGQLLFNKSDFKQASTHFNTVIDLYPDSNKRCDALLKLGMVAQKQNNLGDAAELYKKVLNECADTSAARLAKNRLSAL